MRNIIFAIMAMVAACTTTPSGTPDNSSSRVERDEVLTRKAKAIHKRAEAKITRATSAQLRRFMSETALRNYLEAIEDASSSFYYSSDDEDTIIVTGSRISTESFSAPAPSITNNQVQGVDEGDIIKRIGDYIILLQDGRVFTIAIRDGDQPVVESRDRVDVYESADQDTWYDELLVYGDRIVVIGYSYDAEATEVSMLRLGGDGSLSFERRFFLSSDDYFDTENYAARMIGGKLVLHTPMWLEDLSYDDQQITFPVVVPDRGGEGRFKMINGRPLFSATDIYRPVTLLDNPMLHAISICDLDTLGTEEFEGCETTAFISEADHVVFVAGTDVYVWSWRDEDIDCDAEDNKRTDLTWPGMIHRVSLTGEPLAVVPAAGYPVNQFGMTVRDGKFIGLSNWWYACDDRNDGLVQDFMLITLPDSRFGQLFGERMESDYQSLPGIRTAAEIENRFTDQYLLYGGSERRVIEDLFEEKDDDPVAGSPLIAVDLDYPQAPVVLGLPHSVLRLDRVGPRDAIVTGYRQSAGLFISYIVLEAAPEVASRIFLKDRFESELRSHAFNALIDKDGGILGLPTVPNQLEASRSVSRTEASDLTFLTVDKDGILSHAGEILANETGEHPDYQCEVSCIDWYGNSRPIFTDGRIFALSVAEFIEVENIKGTVHELHRLDLTDPKSFQQIDTE